MKDDDGDDEESGEFAVGLGVSIASFTTGDSRGYGRLGGHKRG